MTWQGIHGHDEIVQRFQRAVSTGRLPSTFLFVGLPGVGKRMFALKLAQTLLCQQIPAADFQPCGTCPDCQQVEALAHPDLEVVGKPKDKSFIPLELLIGDKEHRMREGLCYNIALKPYRGGRKMAIIDDADYLNQEGANCLLKTLEEPPPRSVIILIGSSEQKQLPTIRSRCQTVRFRPLARDVVAQLLQTLGHVTDPASAQALAGLSGGSLERALQFVEPEVREFRESLVERLANLPAQATGLAAQVTSFVEAVGKEVPARRERLKLILMVAIEFYRELMQQLSGRPVVVDSALASHVNMFLSRRTLDPEMAAACVERCLDAQAQVDANANLSTLIECWADDVARLSESSVVS